MAKASAKGNEETVAGYFRKVFQENPKLLHGRSNQEVLGRWLQDHPDHKEVPGNVKANLSNVKGILRKRARKGGRPKKAVQAGQTPAPGNGLATAKPKRTLPPLERLEERIDDCMVMARNIDAEKLHHVHSLLRQARNAVVWMQGQ